MSRTPEYRAWLDMKTRCLKESNKFYAHYGGRGITICQRWLESFENFYSDMGNKPSKEYSLERIDNDKGYEPANCKWADWLEQSTNKRVLRKRKSVSPGIYIIKGSYYVKLQRGYRQYHIGVYSKLDDATKAREAAANEYKQFHHLGASAIEKKLKNLMEVKDGTREKGNRGRVLQSSAA